MTVLPDYHQFAGRHWETGSLHNALAYQSAHAPRPPEAGKPLSEAMLLGLSGGIAVGSRKVELKVGDVLIVPPGVIHGWFDIPDHVDYLSFRPSHGVMKNGWVNPTIATK